MSKIIMMMLISFVLIAGGDLIAKDMRFSDLVKWSPDERAIKSKAYIKVRPVAKKSSLEFSVVEYDGVDRVKEPVRSSLAFYRGEFTKACGVVLRDKSDNSIPVQYKITAFWPNGSARFVCFDFMADLVKNSSQKFKLTYGVDVKADYKAAKIDDKSDKKSGQGSVLVAIEDGSVKFQTGQDVILFDHKNSSLVSNKWVTGMAKIATSEKGENTKEVPLIIDSVEVVEKGAVQTTIHLRGHYGLEKRAFVAKDRKTFVTEDMKRFEFWAFPTSIFIRVYHQTGDLRCINSFGYNGDEDKHFVVSYGLRFPCKLASTTMGTFGHKLNAIASVILKKGQAFRLNQYANNQWDTTGGNGLKGKRISGWFSVGTKNSHLLVSLREAWQNWPMAYSLDEQGYLFLEIFGEKRGRGLDLRYRQKDNPNRHHKSHSMITSSSKRFKDDSGHVGALGSAYLGWKNGRAAGIRKIHNFLISFNNSNIAAKGRAYQKPLFIDLDTQRIADTKVLGHVVNLKQSKYQLDNQYFSHLFDLLDVQHESNSMYGWVDWGDIAMSYKDYLQKKSSKKKNFLLVMQGGFGWANGERALGGLMTHFLVTGTPRLFHTARSMVYHNIGIDSEHPGGEFIVGSFHRHNQVHWRDASWHTRQGGWRGSFLYYWFTGDNEVLRQLMETGMDAEANVNSGSDLRPWMNHKEVAFTVKIDNTALSSLAWYTWITTGDANYARTFHAISKFWEFSGKSGRGPRKTNITVKSNGEPDQLEKYFTAKKGRKVFRMYMYWTGYGFDDILLDWASLTGDPSAINAIEYQYKGYAAHNFQQWRWTSPEALYLGWAFFIPKEKWLAKHPLGKEINRWYKFRKGKSLRKLQASFKDFKNDGVYENAMDWAQYSVHQKSPKNDMSISGSEAIENLFILKALEVVQEK